MKEVRRVIFISDGDNPFGQAIGRRFAEEGDRVIVNTRSGEPIRRRSGSGGKAEVTPVRLDLCSRGEVETMLDEVAEQVGVFVWTNRSVQRCDVENCSAELFDESIRENLKSAFVCTQAIGARMARRGEGKIVYLGSIHGEKPTRSSFSYSVAMGALTMLCREAALVLGRRGVGVNLIEMGPVEGDEELFGDSYFPLYTSLRAKIPGGVVGSPEDAAGLVWFLSSAEARYLNGSSVRLDGGFLLHYLDRTPQPPPDPVEGRGR